MLVILSLISLLVGKKNEKRVIFSLELVWSRSPQLLGLEVDDGADEVLFHDDCSDRFPVSGLLVHQETNGLER